MKRIIALGAFLFCVLLVVFAKPALEAARNGVQIWWYTLLPTLLPFFMSVSLIERSGALHSLAKRLRGISAKLSISAYALPLLLLGGMSGYPGGARLAGMLRDAGNISDDEAERLGTVCNLCSPMFFAGAVAIVMFGNSKLLLPLAAGHYGGAIIIAVLSRFISPPKRMQRPQIQEPNSVPFHQSWPITVASSMADMLKVGGSVIFFLVIGEILLQTGVFAVIGAPIELLFSGLPGGSPVPGILMGLMEMTSGCFLIAQTNIPLYAALPICSLLISFGGLSIMMQAFSFVPFRKPWKYVLIKLGHGALAAAITYAIVIASPGSIETFSPGTQPYVDNALSGLTLLFSSALGMATALLLALIAAMPLRRKKAG